LEGRLRQGAVGAFQEADSLDLFQALEELFAPGTAIPADAHDVIETRIGSLAPLVNPVRFLSR